MAQKVEFNESTLPKEFKSLLNALRGLKNFVDVKLDTKFFTEKKIGDFHYFHNFSKSTKNQD